MITAFRQLQTSAAFAKALQWAKLVSITGSTQILVQAISFASGILVIRLLPIEEYGFYTIANMMLGTMILLSDGGISTGVMAQGGKVWQDKEKLGQVLATGMELRKKFAIASLVVSIPVLYYLLTRSGASILTATLISLSLIPAFFAGLSDSLLQIAPKLNQSIVPLQKNYIVVSLWRLLLNVVLIFIFPFTYIAILANGLPRIFGNIQLKKFSDTFIDPEQKPNKEIRADILKVVQKVLPGAVYYCMSGQINIWLISFFGNSKSIAQLGAIGKLSVVLLVFSAIITTIVVPRFARLEEDKRKLLKRFMQIFGLTIVVSIAIVAFFWIFQRQILIILGEQYTGLSYELILNITASCIGFIWGMVYFLCSNRGWIINPVFTIITSILAVVCGLYLFDFSTVTGILYLNIFVGIIELTYHFGYTLYRILRLS